MDSDALRADFSNALNQMREALAIPAENDVIKAGCIQYFEFSFELAWKTIKRTAEEEGLECTSPKSALKTAFGSGWITEEDLWLEMLSARNMIAHTYNAAEALKIHTRLPVYLETMEALARTLAARE